MARRLIIILTGIVLLIAIAVILINPVILFLAKRQLGSIFINSDVVIGRCDLSPFLELNLKNIEVKKDPAYDFRIKEARIEFSVFSLLRMEVPRISLKEVTIMTYLPHDNTSEFSKLLNIKPGKRFSLPGSLMLSDSILDLNFKDLKLKASISVELNLRNRLIEYVDLKVDTIAGNGFYLKGGSLKAVQMSPSEGLSIGQIEYGKFKVKEIHAEARLEDKNLFLSSLFADSLGGKIHGDLNLRIDKDIQYAADLKFINLDGEIFVKEFDLGEKFSLSGRLRGKIALEGRGAELETMRGDFNADEPGGVLSIRDRRYLEDIARNSSQPLDVLIESFTNYRYNTGLIKLYLDRKDLVTDILLNGEAGKFNLTVTIHDFKLRREEI